MDKKAVRGCFNIESYYQGFMEGFAKSAQPLQKLILKEVSFASEKEQKRLF